MANQPIAIVYCLHDDCTYLAASIRSFKKAGKVYAFVSRTAWNGSQGAWERCAEVAASEGAEVVECEFQDEDLHRRHALSMLASSGHRFVMVPDGDEVVEPSLLDALLKVAKLDLADRVYVPMDTYWATPEYVIRPREALQPLLMLNVQKVRQVHIRHYEGGRKLLLDADHGVLHHLSYSGGSERILRKTSVWSHRSEVVSGWVANVWGAWPHNKLLTNLHPTHPSAYGYTERIELPQILKDVGIIPSARPELSRPAKWPKVSLSIPLYGGCEDIKLCLESLAKCKDLLHEVVVVDNASADGAAEVAESFDFVTLIRNEKNEGFAKASNQGYEASTGDVVLFLNSDTVVPRAGLLTLIESLMSSGSVAAAGPHSNRVFGPQQIFSTYSSLDTLDLYAEDLAERCESDREVDMLVGFCLAVKRAVLEEVGSFDADSYGLGTYEDNDFCYRTRRAGYRLLIASRSFVHHTGSRTLSRMPSHPVALLRRNQQVFVNKWKEDIQSGFASHLSGLSADPIRFFPEKHPDIRRKKICELKERAGVSLVMIARNEERVLGDCLASAKPFFNQIVVVDTGSTDRTKEIAKEYGAEVYDFPWTDSFADARNESLKHSKGRWNCWIDADDTLPWATGEAILQAALNAPPEIGGFVIPVQFIDEECGSGPTGHASPFTRHVISGTRVDHVKLFRNVPGLTWEGRIHEQILRSLREHNFEIARLNAVVLHSGYDTSTNGQELKRARDEKLLALDLAERPGHPFCYFNTAMTAHYCSRHEEAVKWMEKSLAVSAPDESHVRKAYALMAVSLRELGRLEESLAALLKGLEVVGHDPELHFQAGLLLTTMGRYEEAKAHYLSIGPDTGDHFSSIDIGILKHKRLFNLGSLCMLMANYREAKEWWLRSMRSVPDFLQSHFALFDAALDAVDYKTAKRVLDGVKEQEGAGPNWTSMGMRLAEATGGPESVEPFLERARRESPNYEPPHLALARRYLETGREYLAIPELQELERFGSAEGAYLLGVCAIAKGNYPVALVHMEVADQLNPGHEMTQEKLTNLRQAISATSENCGE